METPPHPHQTRNITVIFTYVWATNIIQAPISNVFHPQMDVNSTDFVNSYLLDEGTTGIIILELER